MFSTEGMVCVEEKINSVKVEIISSYINQIQTALNEYDPVFEKDKEIFDLLIETANVFEEDIPQIKKSILLRSGTEIRDAYTAVGLLKLYLADNGIKYDSEEKEENVNIKRFWASFILWFENELVKLDLLKAEYVEQDMWNYSLNMDYDYEFKLYRGVEYPDSLRKNSGRFEDIKTFIEIAYKHWIINEGKAHYDYTVEVNERFKIFRLPYRLQNGIVLKQGYKTTYAIDKIINYRMFERKIRFSEDMINSSGLMEKKSALDFLIDALQYLVSIQEGNNKEKKYSSMALNVNSDTNSKVYAVIKQEIRDLMKMSNEYFDIRHNDYLNDAKEAREALNDSHFIEYLYNRAYSLLYVLRLKTKTEPQSLVENSE